MDERFAAGTGTPPGCPPELPPHCLRHSYVSHLVEDGVDPFSCSVRSATRGRPRLRSTPRSGPTRRTGCCARRWPARSRSRPGDRLLTRRGVGGGEDAAEAGRLSLASAAADGRAGHVRHHRPAAAAGRPRGRVVPGAGLPAGHREPATVEPDHVGGVVRHPGLHADRLGLVEPYRTASLKTTSRRDRRTVEGPADAARTPRRAVERGSSRGSTGGVPEAPCAPPPRPLRARIVPDTP